MDADEIAMNINTRPLSFEPTRCLNVAKLADGRWCIEAYWTLTSTERWVSQGLYQALLETGSRVLLDI